MTDMLNINREQEALKAFDRLEMRRLNGKFDFTIIVRNQKIYAHQNILTSESDYFDAMLSHDTKERQNGKVDMKDVDFESVKICIDHIYRREISVPVEKYFDVMNAATMMQLHVLCNALEEKISRNLTMNTFFPIQELAILFEKQELIEKCRQFAAENFESISKEDKFNILEKSFLVELIRSESSEIYEKRKLEVILEWVRFDESRNSHMLELLKCIDFSQIPRDVRVSYIKNEPLINTSNECVVFFNDAIISPSNKSKKDKPTSKNQMVIFGKKLESFSLLDPAEISFKQLSWRQFGFEFYSVVNLDGHLYVLGDDQSLCRLKYSEVEAAWERLANMSEPHGYWPPAVVLGEHIYVIGGHENCFTSAVERYNPQDDRWELLQEAPNAIQYAGILASGNHIYNFGGMVNGWYVNNVTRLDVRTSQWQKLHPMSEIKGFAAVAECGGFIYFAGGWVFDYLKTFERYDSSDNQWTVLSQMNTGRSWFNLHVVGKFLYAVGGYNSSARSIEKYDRENDTWITLDKNTPYPIAYSITI